MAISPESHTPKSLRNICQVAIGTSFKHLSSLYSDCLFIFLIDYQSL